MVFSLFAADDASRSFSSPSKNYLFALFAATNCERHHLSMREPACHDSCFARYFVFSALDLLFFLPYKLIVRYREEY